MIDDREVDRVVELAQLALTPDERERLVGELSTILDYVARLREVEVRDPAAGEDDAVQDAAAGDGDSVSDADDRGARPAILAGTPLRDDVVAPPLPRDLVLANAPWAEAGLFRLPRLLD